VPNSPVAHIPVQRPNDSKPHAHMSKQAIATAIRARILNRRRPFWIHPFCIRGEVVVSSTNTSQTDQIVLVREFLIYFVHHLVMCKSHDDRTGRDTGQRDNPNYGANCHCRSF
jgi:hypothetical protein